MSLLPGGGPVGFTGAAVWGEGVRSGPTVGGAILPALQTSLVHRLDRKYLLLLELFSVRLMKHFCAQSSSDGLYPMAFFSHCLYVWWMRMLGTD